MDVRYNGAAKPTTCSFSGYRPEKLPWGVNEDDPRCIRLKNRIYDTVSGLYAAGFRWFVCGMARGADMYFCEAVLKLRGVFTGVTLEAALPCENQAQRWSERERSRYYRLVEQCDVETLISRAYTAECMRQRNRYMVDKSGLLVVVFDGKYGGTMYTRTYAARAGVEIIELRP